MIGGVVVNETAWFPANILRLIDVGDGGSEFDGRVHCMLLSCRDVVVSWIFCVSIGLTCSQLLCRWQLTQAGLLRKFVLFGSHVSLSWRVMMSLSGPSWSTMPSPQKAIGTRHMLDCSIEISPGVCAWVGEFIDNEKMMTINILNIVHDFGERIKWSSHFAKVFALLSLI